MRRFKTYLIILITTICSIGVSSCTQKKTLFQRMSSSKTGIHFNNKVIEDDKYNVLEYMNIYTGAGVAAGDVNNDGLTDLFFSGNQTSGRLYINKGNFEFEDVTEKAGLLSNRWQTGVSMVDINQDGWLDIYVNVSGSAKFGDLSNLLYINNGNGTFTEEAAKYGIAEKRLTMNASFFDYDRDGDLDLFLITNPADEMVSGVNNISPRKTNGESEGTDILYRNNGNGTFTDVSREAGILMDGYSLGAAISDLNNDGWPDIYVSNDFLTNDILYINNRDGTFSDRTRECLKHTSFASMGNDVADFNNDGLPDIFVLDMLPEDNYRKKMIIPPASYDKFQLSLQRGYEPQYTRNTLQLNNGDGTFSDIAFLSGVSSTDWSWASLWADFDNDGDKDLMVTNGFYRDLGNLDYINSLAKLNSPMGNQDTKREEKLKSISGLPALPLTDYLFENNGDLTFKNRSADWGFTKPGFSNGACYADLDNDGDLELIVNEFNNEAGIYQNKSEEFVKNNFLTIKLEGSGPNIQGIGAKLWLYAGGKMQFQEFNPYRGFESSMEPLLHFGIGKNTEADSVIIVWPDQTRQVNLHLAANKRHIVKYENTGIKEDSLNAHDVASNAVVKEMSADLNINYIHKENEFVDFKIQPLVPHLHSQNGPGIAVGDVNGDGREDFFVGAAKNSTASFFIQDAGGKFEQHPFGENSQSDNMGTLLFDADGDNDLDLYIVGGGSENKDGTDAQQDRLYINNGKGDFIYAPNSLPDTKASGSCVTACDYDKDGDLDLFVGGRVTPGSYPLPCRSYLLRNDSKPGSEPVFTDITASASKDLIKPGMVTSALWTDFDNDGWTDLIITGEFMPIRFFKNEKGKLNEITNQTGLGNISGWWNSIAAADFDEDGDIDYVVGNLGLNSRHKASEKEPLSVYAKDFDKDGLIDPVMCYYTQGKNYVYCTRDEMIKQMTPMRGRFKTYNSFASVTFEESFLKEELENAYVVKSTCFESSYIENLGGGKFKRHALPTAAQFSPLFGMLTGDYNGDGYLDVLVGGNSYATEVSTGRYDAMNGLLLAGDGKGNFVAENSVKTGFTADKDVKGMAELYLNNGNSIALVANNNDRMQAFEFNKKPTHLIARKPDDAYCIVHKKSGKSYRQEFYHGNTYLSQSSRQLSVGDDVTAVSIFNTRGGSRELQMQK